MMGMGHYSSISMGMEHYSSVGMGHYSVWVWDITWYSHLHVVRTLELCFYFYMVLPE